MDPSKAHDVRCLLLGHLNLAVVVHGLTDSRCIMSCPSNTLSVPQ
jgi:hypothetical protein